MNETGVIEMSKVILPAYRRNTRKACAALNNRVPVGYTTAIASNGDFVVYSCGRIVGRLTPGNFEKFIK